MTEKTIVLKKHRRFPWMLVVLMLVLGGAAWGWQYRSSRAKGTVEYETAAIVKGDVSSHVSATGTLDAVTKIEVGSEVSGIISHMYVDYNTKVVKGQPLAQIDPSTFQAQVDQQTAAVSNATAQYHNQIANQANAEANIRSADAGVAGATARFETARAGVANAQAGLRSAHANVQKAQADLDQAVTNYNRYKVLIAKDLVAKSERDTAYTQFLTAKATLAQVSSSVDAAQAQYRSAQANLDAARSDIDAARMKRESAVAQRDASAAQVRAAQAQVSQAQANLQQAQVNMRRTTIRSPISGIVLDRKITLGQTVAASFQAPDLFTLAENLEQMQVQTSVDEADIGRVSKGAKVTFTVDAYPNTKFDGKVSEVRQAPVTVQNVVTYTVIVATRNPEHKLKPGMTATVNVDVETRSDTLLVPNAALRFKPPASDKDKESPSPSGSPGRRRGEASGAPHEGAKNGAGKGEGRPQRVWTLDPNDSTKVVGHRVVLGITDGTNTEIVKSDLKEGDKVVTGSNDDGSSSGGKGKARMRFF